MLRAVATDGHRLARVEMPLPEGAAGMPGVIVPRKTVSELRKLIDEAEGEVEVALSDTKIRFAFGTGDADLQADRRHLPRLRAGDPGRQRQDPRGRLPRLRRGGRPRLDHLDREVARGEAELASGTLELVGHQPRAAAARPRSWRSTTPAKRSRSASTPAICSTSPSRSRARMVRFSHGRRRLADHAR